MKNKIIINNKKYKKINNNYQIGFKYVQQYFLDFVLLL